MDIRRVLIIPAALSAAVLLSASACEEKRPTSVGYEYEDGQCTLETEYNDGTEDVRPAAPTLCPSPPANFEDVEDEDE